MLYGIDISNWNEPTWDTYKQTDFVIHKATEGRSYSDATMDRHLKDYLMTDNGKEKLIGLYHFGQPKTGNSVQSEVNHFLRIAEPYIGRAILALDMEAGNQGYVQWGMNWLTEVYKRTGVRPMLYTSASNLALWDAAYESNYGLWVANYKSHGNMYPGVKPSNTGAWPYFAIWQWSNGQTPYGKNKLSTYITQKAIDQDIFNGDATAWKKYAEVRP